MPNVVMRESQGPSPQRSHGRGWVRRWRKALFQPPLHPRGFSDVYRVLRASLVGAISMAVLMHQGLPLDEATSIGFLIAMSMDLLVLGRMSMALNAETTRRIFGVWHANRKVLIERAVLLSFISTGVMSLCVHDVHTAHSILPAWVRIFVYFAALFATWMQLHIGFAIYYAKSYFSLNPLPAADGPNPQGFVFEGGDEPVFTDFLYVAFAVGLTYAMSDVNLEDSRMRRMVLMHSVISFLFYSTVISAVLNLLTAS